MNPYSNKWTMDRVYWYARGYHDGRANGLENYYNMEEEYRYYYDKGFKDGGVDHIELDK
jgi:hypothetical protein